MQKQEVNNTPGSMPVLDRKARILIGVYGRQNMDDILHQIV